MTKNEIKQAARRLGVTLDNTTVRKLFGSKEALLKVHGAAIVKALHAAGKIEVEVGAEGLGTVSGTDAEKLIADRAKGA